MSNTDKPKDNVLEVPAPFTDATLAGANKLGLIFFLLVLMGVMSQFASDNFLPSLPYMAVDLHTTNEIAKLSIGLYFLGLCGSTLIYGPLADAFGRRRILLIGYAIFIGGCILVTTTHSITQLLIGRVIQACGIGAGAALFRTIMRDVYTGKQLAKVGSYLGMVFAIVPPLAPISGGYIQEIFGWRANFVLLLILSILLTAIIALMLPETLHPNNRRSRTFQEILAAYKELIIHRDFLGYTACSSLAFANIIAYLTVSPFLFQHTLHLSPEQYGWLAPFSTLSYLAGALLNVRLLNIYPSRQLLRFAGFGMLMGSTIMLVIGLSGILNIWVVILPLMLLGCSNGLVFSNAFAGAFEPFPHAAGMTGALFSSLQMLTAGLVGAFASLIPAHSQVPMAAFLVLISTLIILNIRFVLGIKHS